MFSNGLDERPRRAHVLNVFNTSLYGQRVGRIAFGVPLLIGTAVLVQRLGADDPRSWLTVLVTWSAAFVACAIARLALARREVAFDDQLATASLVVPSVGIALLLPITLHLPFAVLINGSDTARGYDTWVAFSLGVTWPTHVVFAGLIAIRAIQLTKQRPALSPTLIFVLGTAMSWHLIVEWPLFIVVFIGMIVGATGLPFLGLMKRMETIVEAERLAVPPAIAIHTGGRL